MKNEQASKSLPLCVDVEMCDCEIFQAACKTEKRRRDFSQKNREREREREKRRQLHLVG
jgi:hypothetical protein